MERGGYSVAQMFIQVVLARLLTPNDFGVLAIMLVFINIANVFVQSGLNTALIQTPVENEDDYSTVFILSLGISLVLYIAIFAASPAIAGFYSMPSLVWPLRTLSLVLFVNSLNSVQVAKVTREMRMKKTFKATLKSVSCSGIVGIALAYAGAGVWALVGQQLTYQTVNCIALSREVSWRPKLVFSAMRARELFSFGSRLLISGLIEQGYGSLADLIIGRQFSSAQLGLVSQGKKYPASIGSMLDGAIRPVMLSAVSQVQHDREQVKRLVRRALKTSTFLVVPSMVAFACCAPTLVPMLLGAQWAKAIPFMQIYCLIYTMLPIHTTNLQALNGLGRSDMFLRLEIIKELYGLVALLFCAFVLKDAYLLVASYLLTDIVSTFVNAWPNRRIIGYSYLEQVRDIAPAFLFAGMASIPTLYIASLGFGGVSTVLIQCVVFSGIYLLLSAVTKLEAFTYLLKTIRSYTSGS